MARGRPLQFDPDQALEAAMQRFWSAGFEATSLRDLLNAMGIGRSSFYQAYGSKQEVFLRAMERYRDRLVRELRSSLAESRSGLAFIERTMRSVADDTRKADGRRGCLVFNSAAEFGARDRQMSGRVAADIDALTRIFTDAVRQAQSEGEIPPERDPVLLGRHVVCSMSGLRTLAKAGARRAELRQLADVALQCLS